MPACFPEQSLSSGRGFLERAIEAGSKGYEGGHRSASAERPARLNRPSTTRTCSGSPLCEEHMTASWRAGRSSAIACRQTAAWIGFMHERANTGRAASPADATTRPSRSQTATSPRCTDSWSPERITRAS